jgi:ABC-2 type transport system permease protein
VKPDPTGRDRGRAEGDGPPRRSRNRPVDPAKRYRFIEFFVPGIIAMAIATSCLSNALNMNASCARRILRRRDTPITRADWLASRIVFQLILSVISTAAILLVSYFVFDVRLTSGSGCR